MKNKDKIILDLCGGTGSWSNPYKEAGYDVKLVTLPGLDVRTYESTDNVYGILAAPPCTMFSRARTTGGMRDFYIAMQVVESCLNIIWKIEKHSHFSLKFWAMENPRGHLQRFLGKPAFKFQPWIFGDRYSKETWIWGNFKEPKVTKNKQLSKKEILDSKKNRRKLPLLPEGYILPKGQMVLSARRSITPQGFANAFFKANQ